MRLSHECLFCFKESLLCLVVGLAPFGELFFKGAGVFAVTDLFAELLEVVDEF